MGHGSAADKPTHTQAVLNEAQFQELKDSLSSLVIEGFALAENQLPDGHNVAVNNLAGIENLLLEVTTPLDTQPVSADTLPLPTGAATADKQLPDNHQVTVSNQIQQPTRPTDTQPISAAELPLPAGAATEAKQLPDNHQVTVSNFPATQAVSGTVSVDNFPATQDVSGTVALDSATLAALESVSVQNTVTVQATDLDIRNLSSASDSVTVGNFPVTQDVSGTVTVSNFPATQPVSGTVTANLGTLNGAATEAKQDAGIASLSSIDGKLPDLSGTWGYDSGTSGSVTIGAGKRVLQITAVAGALGATMTINGGSTATIPALTSITLEPRGNLTAPALVFTGTTAYFVEHVS